MLDSSAPRSPHYRILSLALLKNNHIQISIKESEMELNLVFQLAQLWMKSRRVWKIIILYSKPQVKRIIDRVIYKILM